MWTCAQLEIQDSHPSQFGVLSVLVIVSTAEYTHHTHPHFPQKIITPVQTLPIASGEKAIHDDKKKKKKKISTACFQNQSPLRDNKNLDLAVMVVMCVCF